MTETTMEQKNGGRKGGRLGIILLIVLLLLVAAGLAGGYFLQQNELAHLQAGRAAIAAGEWETAVAEFDPVVAPPLPFLAQHSIEAAGLRGVAYYQLGQSELALADLTVALERDPNLVDLYAYRALLQFEAGETAAALADSAQALPQSELLPTHLQARLNANRAVALFAEGDRGAAAEAAVQAEAAASYLPDGLLGEVYVVLAQTAETAEETVGYGRELASLGTMVDEAVTAQLLLAQIGVAQEVGDDAAVLALSTELLTQADTLADVQIAEIYLRQAEIFLTRGEMEMALELAQKAADYDEALAFPLALEGWQLYQQFEFDGALSKAEAALEREESGLAYRVRGAVHAEQSRFVEAAADLEQAVALDAEDAEAWLLLARVYHLQSRFDAFMLAAETAVEVAPASVAGLWAQGLLHDFVYEYDLARVAFTAALELDDGRPNLYLDRSQSYYLTSDDPERLADIEQALRLNPDYPSALMVEAAYYLDRYDSSVLDENIDLLEEVAPESFELYTLQAIRATTNDEPDKALGYLNQAEALNETSGFLQRIRISLLYPLEEWSIAEERLRNLLEQNPGSVFTRAELAHTLSMQGDFAEAYAVLDEARELAPFLSWIYVQYANVAFNEGDLDKVWEYAQQALILDPQVADAYIYRGIVHSHVGGFVAATSDYTRAVDIYPDYGHAHFLLGANYLDLGEFDAARREFDRVIELLPDDPRPHYMLSLIALIEEDFEESEAQIWLYADKSEATAEKYVDHAGILFDLGLYDLSLLVAQEGLFEFEDVSDLHYFKGLNLLYLGNKEEAQASLEAALSYPAPVDRVVQIEDDLIASRSAAEVVGDLFVVTDEALGYTVGYPTDWVPQDAESLQAAFFVGIDADDKFGAAYLAVIEDLPGVSSRALADLIAQQLSNQLGYTELSLTTTTFGGRDGVWVREYELNLGNGFILTGRQYYLAVSPGTAYILTVETMPEAQEATAEDIQRIVDSFAIIP